MLNDLTRSNTGSAFETKRIDLSSLAAHLDLFVTQLGLEISLQLIVDAHGDLEDQTRRSFTLERVTLSRKTPGFLEEFRKAGTIKGREVSLEGQELRVERLLRQFPGARPPTEAGRAAREQA